MSNKNTKNIVIVASIWMAFRDLLASGFVAELLQQNYNINIVSPYSKKLLEKNFNHPNIFYHHLPQQKLGIFEKVIGKLLELLFLKVSNTYRVKVRANKSIVRHLITKCMFHLPSIVVSFCVALLRILYKYTVKNICVYEQLNQLNPDLIVTTQGVGTLRRSDDRYYILEGQKLKIPQLHIQSSWDNLNSKGFFPCVPSIITVWNEEMKKQLYDYQFVFKKQINVFGNMAHDAFISKLLKHNNRQKTNICCKEYPIVILFCCAGKGVFDNEVDVVFKFYSILANVLTKKFKFIVREHPASNVEDAYNIYQKKYDNFIVQKYPNKFESIGGPMFVEDLNKLIDTIIMSDLIINCCSSINIDARILNKSVLNLTWDLSEENKNSDNSILIEQFEHNIYIMKKNWIVSPQSISQIRSYLKEFVILTENEHSKFLKEFCANANGDSVKRNIEFVISMLNSNKN